MSEVWLCCINLHCPILYFYVWTFYQFVCLFLVLGVELRTSCLPHKWSATDHILCVYLWPSFVLFLSHSTRSNGGGNSQCQILLWRAHVYCTVFRLLFSHPHCCCSASLPSVRNGGILYTFPSGDWVNKVLFSRALLTLLPLLLSLLLSFPVLTFKRPESTKVLGWMEKELLWTSGCRVGWLIC